MAEEDEVGQEFDRVIRSAVMAFGQLREGAARRSAAQSQEMRDAALVATRQQENVTSRLLRAVQTESFWNAADGERVANAATYGATLYNTDHNAAAVYDVVRDQVWQRYGLSVDALRAEYPENEVQRRNALAHAMDDRLAVAREEALAREDRGQAADLHQSADAEHELADDERSGGVATDESAAHEENASELEDASKAADGDAHLHEADRDHHAADAGKEQSVAAATPAPSPTVSAAAVKASAPAAKARQQASASYPTAPSVALAESRAGRQPKGRGAKGSPRKGPGRGSGLGR